MFSLPPARAGFFVFFFVASFAGFGAVAQDAPHHGAQGPPAFTEEHGGEGHAARPWSGDIHHFHEGDIATWRAGHWVHGPHEGRSGWWWVLDSGWYFYPSPVYPYPDPYLPPLIATPPAVRMWYWCPNPRGYYPNVAVCGAAWREVPAY